MFITVLLPTAYSRNRWFCYFSLHGECDLRKAATARIGLTLAAILQERNHEITTKKLIAREFLMFLVCFAISVIGFTLTFAYNYIKENQLIKLQKEIVSNENNNKKLKSYDKKYEARAQLYKRINQKFDLSNSTYNNAEKLWARLNTLIQKDSLKYKYEHNSDLRESFKIARLLNLKSIEKFVQKNNLTEAEVLEFKKTERSTKFVNSLKSKSMGIKSDILSDFEKREFTLKLFLSVFAIIFPLRYRYYSVKWSLKILKQ